MRVLITGGVGLIGRAATSLLRARGWDVRLIDVVPADAVDDPSYEVCDIMDLDAVRARVRGCDAVIHLAALRNPMVGPGHDVYRINTSGTFNVFEAAAKEGVRRIAQASSINAIGCGWNIGGFTPAYLPIDEDHPSESTDPYALSKRHVEDIGAYYWRRDGIVSIALRFPGVLQRHQTADPQFHENRAAMHKYLDEFIGLPPNEQSRIMGAVRERGLAYRRTRPLEYPGQWPRFGPTDSLDTALYRAFAFDRHHAWATLDERDAALAIERSLTRDLTGAHTLFVNNEINVLDYDSEALARIFYPETTERRGPLTGSESLVSAARAKALLDFVPQYPLPRIAQVPTG